MKKVTMQVISEVLERHETQLLQKANVVGVGIGEKIQRGIPKGILSLKVYVEKKVAQTQLTKEDVVPQKLSGVESDVEEVGKVVALANSGRYRPALGGVSIGHYKITAGTFGCLVKDRKNQTVFILSNNHVFANSNHAQKKDPILQPGNYDGGKEPEDVIASLERWIEIGFGTEGNLVDAALAKPKSKSLVKPEILQIGVPVGVGRAELGMFVQKSGRTTGYTTGKVKDISVTVKVQYDKNSALFRNQILTTAMSQGGDSGSLVLDEKKRAVGLLFAGSSVVTICNPISEVLKLLEVVLFI